MTEFGTLFGRADSGSGPDGLLLNGFICLEKWHCYVLWNEPLTTYTLHGLRNWSSTLACHSLIT